MHFSPHEITFDSSQSAAERWADIMRNTHGLTCSFDTRQSLDSSVKSWKLGDVGVSLANLAVQTLSPVGEEIPSWQGDWLFVKLVTEGHVHVRWREQGQRFDSGSIFVIDPAYPFVEIFPERAEMTVLRIPKATLRDRGVHFSAVGPLACDTLSPDIRATSELIKCIASQSTTPSQIAQNIMGEHLLELVQVAVIDPAARSRRRSSEALTYQARRYIDDHLGDADLDIARIAGAVHVSAQHLQRLFRARGTSLMRYVWQARLERAAHLLRVNGSRGCSIQEIAWQCGFTTAAHFSRLFRRRYGESPSDYRYSSTQNQCE
ncbi:helix-turn-helix domain-containing protein [Paraburkholderia caffeinilytica]|uniref:helix-turn-helix domain-containing protein n=1 Tax=Paraburkholderia caffeinilytica TaxID=1761016 RepID=UPI0038BD6C5C